MLLWALFVLFAIYFYVQVIKPHSHWRDRGVPYKKPWPIIGNMARTFLRSTTLAENIAELYSEVKGRYAGLYQFLQPVLILKDPELIKQVAVKDFDSFLDHQQFFSEDIDPIFGKNVFSLKGQRWRHMRSTLSPAFTGSKMRAMYTLMWDCAEQYTDYFIKQSRIEPVSIEMKDTFTRFANDVIATCAFGFKCDSMTEKDNDFYRNGFKATDFSGLNGLKFFLHSLSPALMEYFKIKFISDDTADFFRGIIRDTMEIREKEGIIRPDMIHLLMEARKGLLKHEEKKDEDAGFATVEESQVGKENVSKELSLDDITAQAVLFFLAGFDTISGSMCHMAHELAINPDIQQRLRAEIDEAFEENSGKMPYEVLMKMKYLDMVVSEGLRKWPTSIFTDRICTKSYTLPPVEDGAKSVQIQKGDLLWIPIFGLHRDPKYYPNPEKFDPERFSDDNKDKIEPFTFIPFGSGPRNCIGSRFALMEIKTIFVMFLRKFDIVVTEKTQIPLKLSRDNFNLNAEKGFWLGLQPRTAT